MADDLDAILDDALDDFDTTLDEDDTVIEDTNDDKLNSLISAAASDISITQTKNETSSNNNKTTSTNNNNSESKNDNSQDAIEQALNAVASSFNEANLNNSSNNKGGLDGLGTDDMSGILNSLLDSFDPENENKDGNDGDGDGDGGFDDALKNIMTSIFDPSSLHEPISMIVDKYPKWLKENKSKLTEKQYSNYEQQYTTYLKAWNLLQKNKNGSKDGNDHNDEIMDLLFQTFSYGSLPADVMDGMMPDELKPFAQKMTQLEQDIENEDTPNGSNNNTNNGGNQEEFDMAEAMKLFEQMIGDIGEENDNNNNNNGNNNNSSEKDSTSGFKPDFNQIPNLKPEEIAQFQKLMQENGEGCNIM